MQDTLPWEGSWPGSNLNHNWLIATSKWPCPVLISIPMLKNRPVAITKCSLVGLPRKVFPFLAMIPIALLATITIANENPD